ncbi:hypothetical protein IAU59_002578 [Kwoniella sp. CBS 9459]
MSSEQRSQQGNSEVNGQTYMSQQYSHMYPSTAHNGLPSAHSPSHATTSMAPCFAPVYDSHKNPNSLRHDAQMMLLEQTVPITDVDVSYKPAMASQYGVPVPDLTVTNPHRGTDYSSQFDPLFRPRDPSWDVNPVVHRFASSTIHGPGCSRGSQSTSMASIAESRKAPDDACIIAPCPIYSGMRTEASGVTNLYRSEETSCYMRPSNPSIQAPAN